MLIRDNQEAPEPVAEPRATSAAAGCLRSFAVLFGAVLLGIGGTLAYQHLAGLVRSFCGG